MGDALTAIPLAALIAMAPVAAAPPATAAVRSDAPLREIGRVRATTPFCRTALTHALAGITVLTENDSRLREAQATMRRVDLDSSVVVKAAGAEELNRQYVAMRAADVTGRGSIELLKNEAADAPTATQKKAILSLANALDGALNRQKGLADALGRLVVYVDNHDPVDKDTHDRMQFDAILSQSRMHAIRPAQGALSTVPDSLTTITKQGADELEERARLMTDDENDAASRIDAAFAGC